jgi:hypothetical protein
MPIQRMDNVLIVVDDLEAAKAFFAELGRPHSLRRPGEPRGRFDSMALPTRRPVAHACQREDSRCP